MIYIYVYIYSISYLYIYYIYTYTFTYIYIYIYTHIGVLFRHKGWNVICREMDKNVDYGNKSSKKNNEYFLYAKCRQKLIIVTLTITIWLKNRDCLVEGSSRRGEKITC
jgi:hypothetical protein